jgi:hypothetical protein
VKPALEQNWGRQEYVDPWGPCFRHDVPLVEKILRECGRVAPLAGVPVTVFVSLWEGLARTNGWAYEDTAHYDASEVPDWWHGPGPRPFEGVIALSGRRIEIHPAVTRYVVAHEYGHLVDEYLQRLRYPGQTGGELQRDYAKMRGLDPSTPYGSGTHHLHPGEVLANDFRSHVLGLEQEFWPHPVKPAWQLKRVARWWEKAMHDLRSLEPRRT